MKIAVVNGLLANENEMKKILDLVIHEFDKYDVVINNIELSTEKLNMFSGVGTAQMDQLFNKILVSDAVIFATSIHMGNITPLMQNFFNYFEINKYRSAMQNKIVLPVLIHNTDDEIQSYGMMMNFFKRFNTYEVNKLFLQIPNVISDEYLDKTIKYIKARTKEFASLLDPAKVNTVSKTEVSNKQINEILTSNELVYDENQLTLDTITPVEKNISELTGMVNDKLKAKAIVKEDEKEKAVSEISQKYKSKIEQIMQETLFGDDNDEVDDEKTVAEAIFENNQMAPKVEVKEEPTAHINFKKNVEERKISMEEEAIEKQEAEDLDSLIARVVAKTKLEKEAQREKEDEERASRKATVSFSSNANTPELVMPATSNITFEEEPVIEDKDNTEEFVKIVRNTDEEMKKEANEINEIRFIQSKPEVKEEIKEEVSFAEVPVVKERVNEDIDRFEPDSIKELRKKLLDMRSQRNEIVEEVNEMKKDLAVEVQEEPKVSITKFALEDFQEPHEIVSYEEVPTTKNVESSVKMSLKDMTKNLIYLFKAPEGEVMKSLIQINVEGDEGFNLYFNIVDNKCSSFDGINMSNDITIYVKDENWRSILDGEVTLQRAFMTGLVKVTGNFMMLGKLDNTLLAYNKQ